MLMQMKESKFGAPEGVYLGKFLGVQLMKDDGVPRLGRDGRPMEPGMEWQWEITDDPDGRGASVGQIVGRITSQAPTTKNACGQLLRGVLGRAVGAGEQVELDDYVGHLYRITIGRSQYNPEKLQVLQVGAVKTGPAVAPAPAAPPKAPGAPPRPPARPAVPPPALRYWVQTEAEDPILMPIPEIVSWLQKSKATPSEVSAIPEDQQGGWKTLADFGLNAEAPF